MHSISIFPHGAGPLLPHDAHTSPNETHLTIFSNKDKSSSLLRVFSVGHHDMCNCFRVFPFLARLLAANLCLSLPLSPSLFFSLSLSTHRPRHLVFTQLCTCLSQYDNMLCAEVCSSLTFNRASHKPSKREGCTLFLREPCLSVSLRLNRPD